MLIPTDFDLSIYHLCFFVEAITPIAMGEFKGSALRGAWTGYMRRAYCGAPPHTRSDPMHEAICPVCYLTSRDTGAEGRRPFALQPPLSRQSTYQPGEQFSFGFSLFGNATTLFPYLMLAIREVGETHGIGQKLEGGQERGRYQLVRVVAMDPHTDREQILFQAPATMVAQPTVVVDATGIASRASAMMEQFQCNPQYLQLRLHTPLRLIHDNHLMRTFSFAPFFQRLVERLFALGEHFGAEPAQYDRSALRAEIQRLLPLAQGVTVAEDQSHWWDVKGYSSRLKKPQYLGGLVGTVTLACEDWSLLLPYLLWGQSTQLGKNIVKGGGWYEIAKIE